MIEKIKKSIKNYTEYKLEIMMNVKNGNIWLNIRKSCLIDSISNKLIVVTTYHYTRIMYYIFK